jgi:hypothetical protein
VKFDRSGSYSDKKHEMEEDTRPVSSRYLFLVCDSWSSAKAASTFGCLSMLIVTRLSPKVFQFLISNSYSRCQVCDSWSSAKVASTFGCLSMLIATQLSQKSIPISYFLFLFTLLE